MTDLSHNTPRPHGFSLFRRFHKLAHPHTRTEKAILYGLTAVFVASVVLMLFAVNKSFLVGVPARGGALTEGIVGSPRFVNPLLAFSDADNDLVSLVYSGLMKATPDGNLVDDLAESHTVSSDGLTYTFTLRSNAIFHNGAKVTADDVVFTIHMAQDPLLKSPKRANWDGVTAEKVDGQTVRFTLKQPYPPFLKNTTMGILPKEIWKDADADQFPFSPLNTEPVGSGPYKVSKVKRTSAGTVSQYKLTAFSDYTLGEPYIGTLNVRFFSNDEGAINALKSGAIESLAGLPPANALELSNDSTRIEKAPLPRVFGIFFNQNQAAVFVNPEVRQALNAAIDRENIVQEVLQGYGIAITSPLPQHILDGGLNDNGAILETAIGSTTASSSIAAATKILANAGWKINPVTGIREKKIKGKTVPLSFSISTSNAPELKKVAELVKDDWEKLGAEVTLKFFETGDLNQNVIRPRKYDSLLFGEVIGRDLDVFAFWHSSQRNDPGLNIALYTNTKVDKIIEDARSTEDKAKRQNLYDSFVKEISNDVPAVFLYSPDFIYAVPSSVEGIKLGEITIPGERFLNINQWYIETDRVWKVFTN